MFERLMLVWFGFYLFIISIPSFLSLLVLSVLRVYVFQVVVKLGPAICYLVRKVLNESSVFVQLTGIRFVNSSSYFVHRKGLSCRFLEFALPPQMSHFVYISP